MADQLEQARKLVEAEKYAEAINILKVLAFRSPKNVEVWWLLAQAVDTDNKRIDCLRKVLDLDPNHSEAQLLLSLISNDELPASAPKTDLDRNNDVPTGATQLPSSQQYTEAKPVEISGMTTKIIAEEEPVISGSINEVKAEEIIKLASTAEGEGAEVMTSASATEVKFENFQQQAETIQQQEEDDDDESTSESLVSGPWEHKYIDRWDQLFENEKQLVDSFDPFITDVIKVIDGYHLPVRRERESMTFALDRYKEWCVSGRLGPETSVFLSPAFMKAGFIANELYKRGYLREAAWLTNTVGEIGKVLVSRNQDKYGEEFENALTFYCRIVRIHFEDQIEREKPHQIPELTRLRQKLEVVIQFALGTSFWRGRFDRNYQVDEVLSEDLVNENLAIYFENRLEYLLKNNLTRVQEFFTRNLPIVYRLRLNEQVWYSKMGQEGEWEKALRNADFGDIIENLRAMGDLVIPSRVGLLPPEYLDEVRSAGEDYGQVRNLLRSTGEEVRNYLISTVGEHLNTREPQSPHFQSQSTTGIRSNRTSGRYDTPDRPIDRFRKARHMMHRHPSKALEIVQLLWENDTENAELREWTAFLYMKNNNPSAAETHLRYLNEHRDPQSNRVVDWNLSVLLYNRKDVAGAYQLLLPWVTKYRIVDKELVEVVLALALMLKEYGQFLSLIPRTYHLRFHPLAFQIAYELGDRSLQRLYHTQLVHQMGNRWELQPVQANFSPEELTADVSRAIVKYQINQVMAWLQDRIILKPNDVYNYLELVRVAEKEKGDIVLAYDTLLARLKLETKNGSNPQKIAQACRDLLDLCKRQHRQARTDEERVQRRDMGRKAYKECEAAGASDEVLSSYGMFKPDEDPWTSFQILQNQLGATSRSEDGGQEVIDDYCEKMFDLADDTNLSDMGRKAFEVAKQRGASTWLLEKYSRYNPSGNSTKKSETITGPEVDDPLQQKFPTIPTDEFLWVTAELQRIRTVKAYVDQGQVIRKLIEIIQKVSPVDSTTIMSLIENISTAFQAFSHTNIEQGDERKMLYARAAEYTKRLEVLLLSGTLSTSMTNLLRPYHEGTLRSVLGDLSREVGISPKLDAVVLNRFISPDIDSSTLVLRLSNTSERQVTSVFVEIVIEGDLIRLRERSSAKLSLMEPKQSALLTFPIEKYHIRPEKEVVVSISLRASAEGYQNVDVGVFRRAIPLKTLEQEIGYVSVPSFFRPGKPLELKDEALFQGRGDLINSIRGSFFEGEQTKRYFLDGIRRVGKTSLLNFLPRHLPDTVLPINVNLEGLGIEQQHYSPSTYLHRLCEMILEKLPIIEGSQLPILNRADFDITPGKAFADFVTRVTNAYGGKKVFLMIDEFQLLLEATRDSPFKDALALDQMRFQADHGDLFVLFTGSVRYDRLSQIFDHRIVGSLSRLRISFLSQENMTKVFRAALEKWVIIPDETLDILYDMSGGYPRLIHEYGAHLVDLINREQRTVITPGDVEYVTRNEVLNNNELFSHRWPLDQFGMNEERFVEYFLNNFKDREEVSVPEFFSSVPPRDLPIFRQALDNLRAFEVLDSTRPELIRFQGKAIRLWAELHVDPITRRFTPPKSIEPNAVVDYGQAGIFIDHENMLKTLMRISNNRGVRVPEDKEARAAWLKPIIKNLLREAEKRIRQLDYRVAVAFWARPTEAVFTPIYAELGFSNPQPLDVEKRNAVDFKLVDEVQLAARTAVEKRTRLARAIVVTGDGDMAQTVMSLKNNNVEVQVWGGSGETKLKYNDLLGEQNVIALEDVCGL